MTQEKAPRAPEHLGVLLERARAETARAAGAGPLDREAWRRVVGDRIAARTAVGRQQGTTLEILASSPVWAQELSLLSAEILERLRAAKIAVDRLRFRVGPVEPLVLKAVDPPARPAPLPPELAERLAKVDDPELRTAIAAAASYSLGRTRR